MAIDSKKLILAFLILSFGQSVVAAEKKLIGTNERGEKIYEIEDNDPTKRTFVFQMQGSFAETKLVWDNTSKDALLKETTEAIIEKWKTDPATLKAYKDYGETSKQMGFDFFEARLNNENNQKVWRDEALMKLKDADPGVFLLSTGMFGSFKNSTSNAVTGINLDSFGKPPFTDTLDQSLIKEAIEGSGYREGKPYTYKSYRVYYVLSCYDFIHDYAWTPDFRWGKSDIKTWKGKFEETYFPLVGKSGGAVITHTIYQNLITGNTFSGGRERLGFSSIGSGCEPLKDGSKTLADKTISPNAVPGDFNGQTATGKILNDDKSIDLLDGLSAGVTGGPSDRPYNGISGTVIEKPALSVEDAKKLQLKLAAHLYAIRTIVPPSCLPVREAYPKSAAAWFNEVKTYMAAEKMREKIVKDRTEIMKTYSNTISFSSGDSSAQVKAIDLQLDASNLIIDSLSGSSLFSKDNKATEARASSKIAWTESLLSQTLKSIAIAADEDLALVDAYKLCSTGISSSIAISSKACARKKKVQKCENEKCVEVEEDDPVPGSCELSKTQLPALNSGPMSDLYKLYSIKEVPSKTLNERFVRANDSMNTLIASYPISNVKEYDWTTPLLNCQEKALGKILKSNGVACAANKLTGDNAPEAVTIGDSSEAKTEAKSETGLKLPVPAKITENLKEHFTEMGLSEEDTKEGVAYFNEIWSKDDLSMGQSNIRINYLDKMAIILEEAIQEDRIKLAGLLAERQKVLDYSAKVKNMFLAGSSCSSAAAISAASGVSNAGGSAVNTLSVVANEVSQKSVTENSASGKINLGAPANGIKAVAAQDYSKMAIANVNQVLSNKVGLSQISNNRLSFSDPSIYSNRIKAGLATGGITAGLSSGVSYAAHQNAEIKSTKDSINKKLTLKRLAISGNSQLVAAIADSAQKSEKYNNNKKKNKSTSSSSTKYASLSPGLSNVSAALASMDKKYSTKTTSLTRATSVTPALNKSSSTSKVTTSSSSRASETSTRVKSVSNAPKELTPEEESILADKARIKDAILAVKSDKRDSYTPTEDDSLFEIVTKAHLRNYEKVTVEEKENKN